MQYFVIYAQDKADTLKQRLAARPAHLSRLQTLNSENRLLVAGPCPMAHDLADDALAFTGSVVIAQFSSLTAARQWAEADPYIEAGVYEHVTVKPYKPVLGSAL